MRLLLAEDDAALAEQIITTLKADGFACDHAADGRDGSFLCREYNYDLAVIDLGLPLLDGISLIKQVREEGQNFPVLILTARSHWQDKVEGLEAGADDYLTTPFRPQELLARVHALLRRAHGVTSALAHYGPITIDTRGKSVMVNNMPVELTGFEYNTLLYLAMNSGKTVSKTE